MRHPDAEQDNLAQGNTAHHQEAHSHGQGHHGHNPEFSLDGHALTPDKALQVILV